MVLEFIFPFERLNLVLFTFEPRQKVIQKTGLTHTKAVEAHKYEKTITVIRMALNYISKW